MICETSGSSVVGSAMNSTLYSTLIRAPGRLAIWASCCALLGLMLSRLGLAAEPGPVSKVDHSRLMVYWTPDGREHPVKTPADWSLRRHQILEGMQAAMGRLPERSRLPPLDVQITGRSEQNGLTRLELSYQAEENDRVPALLYLPQGRPAGRKLPAMLALHQTIGIGKGEVAGLGGNPNLHYGLELAQRGYVVLMPDYPSFGAYRYDFQRSVHPSGTIKGVINHMRGVDLLESLEQVDPQRIGVIGHSLGGHNAIFVAVFDQRLRVVVSSCGWTPFGDYYGGKIAGWTSDRYMPRLRTVYALDPDRVPFDFYELVAALAPRAFFSNSPVNDGNFAVSGVKKAETKAREVFALFGAARAVSYTHLTLPTIYSV